jgi:hypothetical protein
MNRRRLTPKDRVWNQSWVCHDRLLNPYFKYIVAMLSALTKDTVLWLYHGCPTSLPSRFSTPMLREPEPHASSRLATS